jgi:NAD(P)-dependent dehydrogenase (short-subunit alcohol dehydrogenase family)
MKPIQHWLLAALLLLSTVVTAAGAASGGAAGDRTVLITGANRGIGLALARDYAARGWQVVACAREPAAATALQALRREFPGVVVEALDITNHGQVDALAARYRNRPIDVLINNAAINGDHRNATFGQMRYDVYAQVHAVNVLGPVKMAEAFLPSIVASRDRKIINITSQQGSIARTRGCCNFYRSSKAALNMMMRNIALELKPQGVIVGLVSPGFVRTDMTAGINLPMMISPEQSAAAVIRVIDGYTLATTGTFIEHDGEEIPW